MATQVMSTAAQRIGIYKGETLAHAEPKEVIGIVCRSQKRSIPKNNGLTVKYRRWLPKGATVNTPNTWSVDPAAHVLGEAETPLAESVTPQDITSTLVQYGVLYRYSDVVADAYEDDVPAEMTKLCGERMGLLREMIRYGKLKAGTNVFRAGGVASRSLTVAKISTTGLRAISRSFQNNLAEFITTYLQGSDKVGSGSVEPSFVAFIASDLANDVRALTGFLHTSDYGVRKILHECELGTWEDFRFVTSPHLGAYLAAGATSASANTVLSNGVPNAGGNEAADIYPIIVLSEMAYGDVMMRGMDSFKFFHRRPGSEGSDSSPDDPLGQRGHVGAKFYMDTVVLNQLHMAVYEVACSALIA